MQKIVPAILTDKKHLFRTMLDSASNFADTVQIDIMDGEFVPSRSITQKDLLESAGRYNAFIEVHLMVQKPLDWLLPCVSIGARRIIFHYEIRSPDYKDIIYKIRGQGLEVGLAVNPDTELGDFAALTDDIDLILFMSVYPGFYGAEFVPEVKDKIRRFKETFPSKTTAIDGGIKKDNLREVASLGLDLICVGSAVFKARDPDLAYNELSALLARGNPPS